VTADGPGGFSTGSIGSESFATVSAEYRVAREDIFAMRRADWERIRGSMVKVRNPVSWLSQAGWAVLSIGATAWIGFVTWPSAYGELPSSAKLRFAWVTPALLVLGTVLVLVAVACWLVSRTVTAYQTVSIDSVLADMDDCAGQSEYALPAPGAVLQVVVERTTAKGKQTKAR
jgi:hypothetical protein